MNLAPFPFLDFCQKSQISKEEAQKFWLRIWQKALEDFLKWLITEGNLSSDQYPKIAKIFTDIQNEEEKGEMILDFLFPALSEEQKKQSLEKLSFYFLFHLKKFLSEREKYG